jgi:ATP-binding cassette, subfamily F, member 3
MIQVTNLSKAYGAQVLFEDINFSLGKGERIGLVGRNGSGKSTLFKILLHEEFSDHGEVSYPKNYSIGTLKQHLSFSQPTILQECATALRGDEEFDQYKVEKMLFGLGFKAEDLQRPPADFSGGYQIRLNLAKLLLTNPNCLLLDEPTNYLDIVSMRWLTRFLQNFRGELILITHDRGFMNNVTTHTMGLWRQKLVKIAGNSDKYYEQILQEEEIYEKTRVNSERKRKDLEEFVNRFKAKASKATQAQSRLKLLEKMPELDELALMSTLDFEFNHKECPGKTLMEIRDLSFSYPLQQPIMEEINFSISRGDKIAVIGKNGKGKSTLLNLLAGELLPQEGSVSRNVNLLPGHFGQTNINRLNLDLTIEEEVASVDPSLSLQRVRSICGTMMFSGDLAKKKIKVLSGGERARVLLAKLLARPTNLLLLDEPTNHLDQESVESLILELQNYPGAVVFVTHSESMLREVASKLVVFHHGKVEFLNDSYDDFLKKIGWEEEGADSGVLSKVKVRLSRQDEKRMRSEIIVQRSRELAPLKKRMQDLEDKIVQLELEQGQLEAALIELAVSGQSKKIQESSQRLGEIKNQIEVFFDELATTGLKHDEIQETYEKKLKLIESSGA